MLGRKAPGVPGNQVNLFQLSLQTSFYPLYVLCVPNHGLAPDFILGTLLPVT